MKAMVAVIACLAFAPPALAQQDTAAPAPAQMPEPITTTGFPEGTQFATAFQSVWTIGHTHLQIRIPEGFVTDFASIPPELQGYLSTQGTYSRAAVIHDYLYWTQACTRQQSDNLLLIAMIESKVPWMQRKAIYRGVRLGGSFAWSKNTHEKAAGLGRFVPANARSMLNAQDWPTVRQTLASQHVQDPAVTITPAICALGNSTAVP